MKDSYILIIGIGSAGERHLQNILSMGYSNISVVSSKDYLLEKYAGIVVYKTLEEALEKCSYDYAIIATPPTNHLSELHKLLDAGVKNIYLEKPISHEMEGLGTIIEKIKNQETAIQVGYDLRFDPGLQKVKSILSEGLIGKPLSVNAFVGQWLPDWRSGDYSKGMSAQKKTGGGVMLDLIHEFDYLYWLFGDVVLLGCFLTNSRILNIETEDIAEIILKFQSGVLGSLHLDYLQKKLTRHCIITGSEGTIRWDLPSQDVYWINSDKEEFHFSYPHFSRNDRFIKCMQDFLSENSHSNKTDFLQGVKSLQLVCAAKIAAEQRQIISPQDLKYSCLL
ncbi:MAG: Gfo/Idh/MocA family oxidoreductase [Bacteroidetes bacterium]|nr:Gfo/Idh/MocA family oxidoreductase [Bacteroidota bacterium]